MNARFFARSPRETDVALGAEWRDEVPSGHTFNLPGYSGTTLSNVQTFVSGNNTIAGGAAYTAFTGSAATASQFVGTTPSCPTP